MLETGPHAPITNVAGTAPTLGAAFRARCRLSRDAPAFYEKPTGQRSGRWQKTTWRGFYDAAAAVAAELVALGLAPGDKVAILGATRSAWAIYDMGAQLAATVSLGIYPKQSVEQVRYLLAQSDARVVFVDGAEELDVVLAAAEGLDHVVAIVPWTVALYDAHRARDPRVKSPADFARAPLSEAAIDARLGAIGPEDTAILIYTSGTTGPPKGAMIAHRHILALLAQQTSFLTFFQDDISLSFLPMAHAAERVLAFYGRISTGIATAYATSTATVLPELQEVQPTLFGSVPRIFEKAHAKVYGELEKKPKLVRRLFDWAVDVGTRKAYLDLADEPVPAWLRLQHAVADRLVFRKVREAFGGRIKYFVTGAAPIAKSILEFFWAAGMPVFEAYGMTEATVITHINHPGAARLGSVGRGIAPMETRVAEDGEILIRGPWIFSGYYKDPEASARTVVDGWLHTGDIGTIDADGFLYITDRKKHLIITAGGKNLAPANIEKAIRETTPLIAQVHAHGDRRRFVSALVAPSPTETLDFGVARGLLTRDRVDALVRELMESPTERSADLEQAMAKVVADRGFREAIARAVAQGNQHLAHVERVAKFALLDRDFSQERGEMTPSMKLKRKAIEELHAATFDRIYDEAGFGIEPRA